MALPWLLALAVEWLVLSRSFAGELQRPRDARPRRRAARAAALRAVVVAATLAGFVLSSAIGIAPVWVAAAPARSCSRCASARAPRELVLAAEPALLVFVLGLGIVVAAAGDHGLSSAVDSLLPARRGLPALLAIAGDQRRRSPTSSTTCRRR